MKKQIWHLELEYEWSNTRKVNGSMKDSKNKYDKTFVTCSVGDTIDELNKNSFLKNTLKKEIGTSKSVNVNIKGWKWREKVGMSNDVY